jgi:hypothetical protein
MEYWSIGVMVEGLKSFFNTPILHHSTTPVLLNFDDLKIYIDKCSIF